MAIELINQIMDEAAIERQLNLLRVGLAELNKSLLDLNGLRVPGKLTEIVGAITLWEKLYVAIDKSVASLDKVKKSENELSLATKEYKKLLDQTATGQAKSNALTSEGAKTSIQVKEALRQQTAELKNTVIANNAAAGSINQLKAQLTLLTNQYNALGTAEQKAAAGKGLQTQIQGTQTQLNKLNADLGKHQGMVGNYANQIGDSFKKLGTQLLQYLGIYGAINIVANFFKGSIEEANKAEQAVTKLKNALENAGRSDLFEKLNTSAEKLGETFQAINPNDIKDVFTKLIDYGKLSENQITSLTTVIINYAAKQNISLQESTDVMTRALEGNVRGLKTYGINIKDAHTVTERFGLIVNDLGNKVKGAEAVFEETNKGAFARFGETFVKLKERVGQFMEGLLGLSKSEHEVAIAAHEQATQGDVLIKQYEELAKKTNKTTEEKNKLKVIESELVGIFGNSIIQVDKETGAYRINIEATKDLIKQKLLLANQDAAKIAAQVSQAQDRRKESTDETLRISQEMNAFMELNKMTVQQAKAIRDAIPHWRTDETPLEKQAQKLLVLNANLGINSKKFKQAGEDMDDYSVELEKLGFKLTDVNKLFNPGDPNATVRHGDPNKSDKPIHEKKKKEIVDLGNYELEVQQKINKAKEDLIDDNLKRQIEYDKAVINDEHKILYERVDALNRYYDEEILLTSRAIDNEIAAKEEQLKRIESLEKKDPKKLTTEQRKEIINKALITQEIINLENKKNDALIDLVTDRENKYINIIKTGSDEEIRIATEGHDKEKASTDTKYTYDVKALNSRFAAGKISQEKYNKERAKLDLAYHTASLQAEINYTQKVLDLMKVRGIDVSKEQAKLAQLQRELDDESKNTHKKTEDDKYTTTIKVLKNIEKIYIGVLGVIGDLVSSNVTAQKNAIQEQMDLNDEKTKREIDAANASTLSEQDKADKIIVIQARAAAQKEQLQRRQKQIDEQQAKFNKAKAIADIILNTATAIVADIKTPWKIIFDAAIGAAQLAIAIATPIPKYKEGRGEGKEELAIVGEGGVNEYIHREDGTIEKTPAVESLTHLMPKDRVYKNKQELMRELAISAMPNLSGWAVNKGGGIEKADMENFTSRIENAVQNIKLPPTTYITKEGWKQTNERIASNNDWINRVIKN